MKPTIKDVAARAGVSIATVSRVMNNRDRVHTATKEKVHRAIEELGFAPSTIARSMVMNETRNIGLLLPFLKNEFWATLAESIEARLWENGYTVTIGMADSRSYAKMKAAVQSMIERKADGIILCSSPADPRELADFTKLVVESAVPAVTFEFDLPGLPSVKSDHIQGSSAAVNHLIRLGHTRIAHIGGPLVSIGRELGYREAHLLQGLPVDENLIRRGEPFFEFGQAAIIDLLEQEAPFTAVFCANDLIALGAVQELQRREFRIPKDISIIGYDNIKAAVLIKPNLTTIAQPVSDMSASLVDTLLKEKNDKPARRLPPKLLFELELIVRETTAAPLMS
ncbi:LacI family DNA-binding transcriptional regulator [Paenibacillus solisilvae]|uniref:LacI family DNA-binding transcriptional regulator n=1 Tax=Paenibacillus solisilvae TaxID=2486751 RepID=A0ABW0VZE0_9BACL